MKREIEMDNSWDLQKSRFLDSLMPYSSYSFKAQIKSIIKLSADISRISFPSFFQSFYFSPCPQPMMHSYRGWSPGWRKVWFTTDLGTMWFVQRSLKHLMIWVEVSPWYLGSFSHWKTRVSNPVDHGPAFGHLFDQCSVGVRQGVKNLTQKITISMAEGPQKWSNKISNCGECERSASGGQISTGAFSVESGEASDSDKIKVPSLGEKKLKTTTCTYVIWCPRLEILARDQGICGQH